MKQQFTLLYDLVTLCIITRFQNQVNIHLSNDLYRIMGFFNARSDISVRPYFSCGAVKYGWHSDYTKRAPTQRNGFRTCL